MYSVLCEAQVLHSVHGRCRRCDLASNRIPTTRHVLTVNTAFRAFLCQLKLDASAPETRTFSSRDMGEVWRRLCSANRFHRCYVRTVSFNAPKQQWRVGMHISLLVETRKIRPPTQDLYLYVPSPPFHPVIPFVAQQGRCNQGDQCQFRHDGPGGGGRDSGTSTGQAPEICRNFQQASASRCVRAKVAWLASISL